MAENDDELKDLFQQKNLENAFPPDEQNWERMAAVLKNERRGFRRLLVYFGFLLLLLGFSSIWFFVKKDGSEIAVNNLARLPQQTVTNNGTALPAGTGQEPLKQKEFKKYPTHIFEKRDVPVLEPKKTENESTKPILVQQLKPTLKPYLKSTKTNTKAPPHPAKKETSPLVNNFVINKNQLAVSGEATGLSSTASQNKKTTVPAHKDSREAKNNNENVKPEVSVKTSENKIESNQSKQENNDPTVLQNLTLEKKLPSDSDSVIKHWPDTGLVNETTVIPIKKQDSVIGKTISPNDSIFNKVKPVHKIFVEAGMNYMLGWKTNNKIEANGINPLLGFRYYHMVSQRMALSGGLQYSTINHLSITSHTSLTSQIRFGEESEVTVISALNMHYLLLPLKISYALNNQNCVSLGYAMAYLLDVQSKVEKYSTRYNYSSDPVVSKSMGYSKGFNPFDAQLTLGYRRCLYKEWYVNGELYYGLRDVKNNKIYNSNNFERAYGFRMSLEINLWKK